MWNVWSPAYAALARAARDRGCDVVLTGRGGDEWLTVSPYYAADLARRGNSWVWRAPALEPEPLAAAHGLALFVAPAEGPGRPSARERGGRRGGPAVVAREAARAPAGAVAPWVAPEAASGPRWMARLDQFIGPARPAGGFYVREMLATLSHPCVTGDLEETQEFGGERGSGRRTPTGTSTWWNCCSACHRGCWMAADGRKRRCGECWRPASRASGSSGRRRRTRCASSTR
jgi:hypothetical protein